MKHEINGYKFWLHQWYKDNMDLVLNEAIPNNWDSVVVVLGIEGAGKTTLASQSALYMDPSFNLDQTVFTPGAFTDAVDDSQEESSILWDEAITGANIRNFADEMNRSIVSKMTQIRDKRLKFFLCFPYLHLLEKYFVSRAIYGVYVYAEDFSDRGHALFYSQPKLEKLYHLMKGPYSNNPMQAYKQVRPNFKFKFDSTLCLAAKEYRIKKNKAREESEKTNIPNKRLILELLRRNVDKNHIREIVKNENNKPVSLRYIQQLDKAMREGMS